MINKKDLHAKGYAILENIFTEIEIEKLLNVIKLSDKKNSTFRKSEDLFAIRQFLNEIPHALPVILNQKFQTIIKDFLGDNLFIVKSIYFDKPQKSNWFVSYHQDLTISVNKKISDKNYGPWTIKQNQFSVQPPEAVLDSIYTIRIHLDDTDENNGALKVIPGSHLKGILRPEMINRNVENEETCIVPKGGIMIMRPLLMHSSGRTTNGKQRRVIHLELSNFELSNDLKWSEKIII